MGVLPPGRLILNNSQNFKNALQFRRERFFRLIYFGFPTLHRILNHLKHTLNSTLTQNRYHIKGVKRRDLFRYWA